MDRLGVDRQVLSPPPVMFCYWAEARAAQAFARMQNETRGGHRRPAIRGALRRDGAPVPLQDTALAIEELRHARERLGSACGRDRHVPGRSRLRRPGPFPFFAACRDLGVAVFVHPAAPLVGQERLTKYYFPLIVGNPLETAVAISKLIYGGVLERLLDLRICFAARRRRVPVHARAARPRLVGPPGGPESIPKRPRSTRGSSTSTRSRTARRIFGSWWPSSGPSGSRWAATTRSTWGALIRWRPSARPDSIRPRGALVEGRRQPSSSPLSADRRAVRSEAWQAVAAGDRVVA